MSWQTGYQYTPVPIAYVVDIGSLTEDAGIGAGDYLVWYDSGTGTHYKIDYDDIARQRIAAGVLETPQVGDRLAIGINDPAVTATHINFASVGGTDITFDIEFHTDIASGGTVIHTDTCTSGSPEYGVTPSGTAAITANRIIMIDVTAVNGSVTQLVVSVDGKRT